MASMILRFSFPLVWLFFMGLPLFGADAFDRYTNPVLAKAPMAAGVQLVERLTPAQITDNEGVVPGVTGALVIVQTNGGRNSKLLLRAARQRVGDKTWPILLIEHFVTYREGEERTVQVSGHNVDLFHDFHFDLDLGQVVPAEVGGDLRFIGDKGKVQLETLGKARMYLVSKPLAEAAAPKGEKLVVGETFEPRYFNGSYKLYDDGRRSGILKLKVNADGEVAGSYYSDKDGQKYDVFGKIGNPHHTIQFTIKFPRTEQTFQGWLFTGDGKALTGHSRLQDRETGFYAIREEQP
jgi:hypothetical protein